MSATDSTPLSPGKRVFYELPVPDETHEQSSDSKGKKPGGDDKEDLLSQVRNNVIGSEAVFKGPFGIRRVVYCDYVASGRSLKFIEDFLSQHVLPTYGNTHTTTSVTSLQSTMFRHEARDIIRNAVRASEHDAVIFTGNGVTGAIHKLINALSFTKPPVIFCGPYEHHSNMLPWRETAAHVVNISETQSGEVNLEHLEIALQVWNPTGLPMIGCFSAASNITGQLSNSAKISVLLHRYGALSFWDYATAAPYVEIDMHPVVKEGDASKDAVFISPHKFVGGIGTPGVLIAARRLFKNPVPTNCGGGSVFFVSEMDHRYLQDEEMREEGGTPDIVGSIRAGLVFKLKQDIACQTIMDREGKLYLKAVQAWKDVANLEILGPQKEMMESSSKKLAVFSFMIRHPQSGLYLHHNFVAALLNDMFGMQVRGGCACAGPYAQALLGIDFVKAKRFETVLLEDTRLDRTHLRRRAEYSSHEVLRPGFVRLNLPYFINDEEADFVVESVKLAAKHAWTMLPNYLFNPETGEWRHIKHQVHKGRKRLGHVRFTSSGMQFQSPVQNDLNKIKTNYSECLREAENIFLKAAKATEAFLPDHPVMFDESVGDLRWFLTPSEAQKWLSRQQGRKVPDPKVHNPPFTVRTCIKQLTADEIKDLCKMPETVKDRIRQLEAPVSVSTNGNVDKVQKDNRNPEPKQGQVSQRPTQSAAAATTNAGKSSSEVRNQKGIKSNGKGDSPLQTPDKANGLNGDQAPIDNAVDSVNVPVAKFISPPKRLFKLTAEAIEEFKMINDGDRVLVCLSGGKDSLSLLHTLRQYQFYAKKQDVRFDLGAVTVDPKTASYDPSPLIQYLSELGLPYYYETQAILDQALAIPEVTSICAFCSRMKRGRMYNCARREGWNVLAMGQHLDDLAESFLMSAFQNGLLRTMKANYTVREGDLRVIRPFVYVREKDTREFAESCKLPIIPENCPACFEAPKERHRMKQLLASQEIIHPRLFYSLKEALLPLMSKNRTGLESGQIMVPQDDMFFDDD